MRPRKFAWSISALASYEQCPKRHYHTRVAKDIKEDFSAAANDGQKNHTAFELRLTKNTELPLDLAHHDKFLQRLLDAPGTGYTEQRIAINNQFEPTGFFDDDCWCRAVIDYMKINSRNAVIVDHKFGKVKDDFDQLKLTCAMVSALKPEVDTYTSMFYWAKAKKITTIKLEKHEIMQVWNDFLPRVRRMEAAFKNSEFPAKESGLCKKWCAVTSCVHNGRY